MSLRACENDGWMHGTDLLPTCTMRLMYQQTLYVHFGKQDVVMEIIRQHLLGPAPVATNPWQNHKFPAQ